MGIMLPVVSYNEVLSFVGIKLVGKDAQIYRLVYPAMCTLNNIAVEIMSDVALGNLLRDFNFDARQHLEHETDRLILIAAFAATCSTARLAVVNSINEDTRLLNMSLQHIWLVDSSKLQALLRSITTLQDLAHT